MNKPVRISVAGALGVLLFVVPALAVGDEWRPVPDDGVITAAGNYFLAGDLSVDRPVGIEVKADGVTLDLRGRALRFTGAPAPGVRGISSSGHRDIRIINGAIGGFWFNVHCTGVERLRVQDVRFDDIPYLALNVAQSKDVLIADNHFSNFRYDIEKDAKSTYIIGVNISADDAVIAHNRFDARPPAGTGRTLQLETVFVLFRPSRNAVVAHNDMSAGELLHRGYGVWVAGEAEASVLHNRIRNVQYGICVAADGVATIARNELVVDPAGTGEKAIETVGIAASGAREVSHAGNSFSGWGTDVNMVPPATSPAKAR
jgi:hypothetical protein